MKLAQLFEGEFELGQIAERVPRISEKKHSKNKELDQRAEPGNVKPVLAGDISAIDITGISADSRQIAPGFVFFALKGAKKDGGDFMSQAQERGAHAIITDMRRNNLKTQIPVLYHPEARRLLALAASRFYPRSPPVLVGVTGTSGKTSVVSFIREIWHDTGFAGASIGTVGVFSPNRQDYGSLTTPDPVALHQTLQDLSDEGVTHVALEASSHGLDQYRLDGLHLTAAGFTNLGRDHMDYHATVADYFRAKMRLFDTLLPEKAPAVVFSDGRAAEQAMEHIRRSKRKILTVGRKGNFIQLKRLEQESGRQFAEFECDGVLYEVLIPLIGEFQIANALVAAGLAIVSGVPAAAVFRALFRLKGAPGRLELVSTTRHGARIYVDYAHKPDALENVLKTLRSVTTGRLIVVFGCGGDRDKGKRPLMGEIAAKFADMTIITDDNPRSEDPATIRHQILRASRNALEIAGRSQAIHRAVAMLNQGDTLVVAGKGHEQGQIIGSEIHPFSDHGEIQAALDS